MQGLETRVSNELRPFAVRQAPILAVRLLGRVLAIAVDRSHGRFRIRVRIGRPRTLALH